jgi:hypothetical protein
MSDTGRGSHLNHSPPGPRRAHPCCASDGGELAGLPAGDVALLDQPADRVGQGDLEVAWGNTQLLRCLGVVAPGGAPDEIGTLKLHRDVDRRDVLDQLNHAATGSSIRAGTVMVGSRRPVTAANPATRSANPRKVPLAM